MYGPHPFKIEEHSRIDEIMLKNMFGNVDENNKENVYEPPDSKENVLETANQQIVMNNVFDILDTKVPENRSELAIANSAKIVKSSKLVPKRRKPAYEVVSSYTHILSPTSENQKTKQVKDTSPQTEPKQFPDMQTQNRLPLQLPVWSVSHTNKAPSIIPTEQKFENKTNDNVPAISISEPKKWQDIPIWTENNKFDLPLTVPVWSNDQAGNESNQSDQNNVDIMKKIETNVNIGQEKAKKKQPSNNQTLTMLENPPKNGQTIMCHLCSKQFVRFTRSEIDGVVKGTRFTQKEIEEHIKTHMKLVSSVPTPTITSCSHCNLEFAPDFLQMHINSVHGEFKCKFCNRRFAQTSNMSTHMKNLHFEEWSKWKVSLISTMS